MNRRKFSGLATGLLAVSTTSCFVTTAAAQLVNKHAEQLQNGEFNWFPERSASGPLLIIVSIPDQLVHVYRNGIRIAASSCSTGKPGHGTPSGVFKILEKDKHHRSSTYNNAPMPNMNRLTWSGIALHAGQLPGYPASHGCVRLPLQFSEMLFGITKTGMTVVIADNATYPSSVTHPGMILSSSAREEFSAVDLSLKKSQYSEGFVVQPKHTSVVVSGKDRSIQVFENDRIIATGKATIAQEDRPLSHSVYTLDGAFPDRKDLRWTSAGYGKSDRKDLAAELSRITADEKIKLEIRRRMHHGMTVVTTNERSIAKNRTSGGFVVIDGLY